MNCGSPNPRGNPKVDPVTTDGFLHPNAVLEERGLLARKGFPESYDRRALLDFVIKVKSGDAVVTAPVHPHVIYDIAPGASQTIERPEDPDPRGLERPAAGPCRRSESHPLAVSDFFDFSVYVTRTPPTSRLVPHPFPRRCANSAFRDPNSSSVAMPR